MAATPTGQGQSLQIYSEKELRKRFPDIHKTSPLASGTFGNVYRARESDTGRLFAVKVQRDGLQQRSTAVADEVRLLNDARGKHVVPLLCAFRVGYMFGAFAMPLADTCLNAFIDSRSSVPPRLSESILAQIFAGVAHLHTRGILHRDLKPANVLLRIDIAVPGDLCVWLADLGAGCRWPPARWRPEPVCADILAGKHGWRHLRWPWSGQVGTVQYCAPEVLQNLRGGCSADCWSAGAIGFELIRGRRLVDSGVAAEALLELDAALQNVAKLPAGRQDTEWTQDLNAQTPTYVRTYTDLRAHICTHVRTYPRSCGHGCEPAIYGARRCVCEGAPPLARKCLCACSRIRKRMHACAFIRNLLIIIRLEELLQLSPEKRPVMRESLALRRGCPCGCGPSARGGGVSARPPSWDEGPVVSDNDLPAGVGIGSPFNKSAGGSQDASAADQHCQEATAASACAASAVQVAGEAVAGGAGSQGAPSAAPSPSAAGLKSCAQGAGALPNIPRPDASMQESAADGDAVGSAALSSMLMPWIPKHEMEDKPCQCGGHCYNAGHRRHGCQAQRRIVSTHTGRWARRWVQTTGGVANAMCACVRACIRTGAHSKRMGTRAHLMYVCA